MYPCPKCGYHNPEDAVRCVNCGYVFLHEEVLQAAAKPEKNGLSENSQAGKKNNIKIIYGPILITILILISVMTISRLEKEQVRSGTFSPLAEGTAQVMVTPKSGGSIPTKNPTITPTALSGMESPLFCKMEMAMIYDKAEMLGGSGKLILDRYDQAAKTCTYIVRGGKFLTEIGSVSTVHTSEDKFGVQVRISESAGIVKSEQMKFWGIASLLALENELSHPEAEKLLESVMEEGTAVWNVYSITLEENPLTKTSTLSIFAQADGNEN